MRGASDMLNSVRDIQDFSRGWRFRRGHVDTGQAPSLDDGDWTPVALPHCWNAEDTFTRTRGYYRGPGWYRKRFVLTEAQCRRRVVLAFGAGYGVADVWLNGDYAGRFMGGFTGFAVEDAGRLHPGENVAALRLTNEHDPDVLPGKETPDYNLYGGLYREARLILKDRLHIPEHGVALTTPSASPAVARLNAGVMVRNDRKTAAEWTCTVSVYDAAGDLVIEKRDWHRLDPGAERLVLFPFPGIRNPALWAPDHPYLYTVQASIEQGKQVIDNVTLRYGFRSFEFRRDDGFTLNGARLKLRGVNRHQDYPGLGNALPERLQVRDAEVIKGMGANFVRTSHYPQHPAFLDACDRLGLLVYEEIASWQFVGGKTFARNAEAMLRQMIVRDRNHPSVILWGLLNEGRSKDLFGRLHTIAHGLDPTRPTVYAENKPEEGIELGCVYVPDVLGINYKLPHMDDIRNMLPEARLLSSEHTNADYAVRGHLGTELRQLEKVAEDVELIEARDYLAGGALWSMHDYGTDYEPVWPVQHSGVVDAYRLPKQAFYYLKCRWNPRPLIYICGHWTWPGEEGQTKQVVVVSNCEQVELFLNGRSLGAQRANPAAWDVPYEPGELVAVGTKDGRKGQKTLKTAGAPAWLRLSAQPGVIRADGRDVAEITAGVTDAAGVVAPVEGDVRFACDGPGVVRGIGGEPVTALAHGLGRIVVQAAETPGTIAVRAAFGALPEARITVEAE